ncbi:hypothetical protein [Serratia ureilytica]|uniref:hypothetical protein n=1 Tax=Serratia ureilytica TaxID=300181 RepID=UPI00044BE661|nr:hypothetical protein [Serratia ureilytica]EZQ62339.1 hypothetical protein AF54_02187 [Serratia marcescens BIDMC 81]
MNRINIGLSIFFVVILCGVVLYLNHSSWKPFRCNTHVSSHIVSMDGRKLKLNLDISVVTAQEGRSEVLVVGSLNGLNKNYAISRRMFVSIKDSDFKGFTKTMITREERHPIDNIPDEIWQQFVLPEAPGVAFYMETKLLSKNLFLVKGLTNPYFVCAVIEH